MWGMNACALCTARHLESISSPRYSSSGLNDPRRKKYFEIFMCCIAPFIFAAIRKSLWEAGFLLSRYSNLILAFHFASPDLIVQGHRFDLVEDVGCSLSTYWSWASIFLFYVPPLFLGLVTTIYGCEYAQTRFCEHRICSLNLVLHSNSPCSPMVYPAPRSVPGSSH